MGTTHQPLLFDRDNLREIFHHPENRKLLEEKYENLNHLYQALIANKAEGSEYIVGLPGAGKTKFALLHKNAQKITQQNIHELLNMQFEKMVFVSSELEEEIAQQAKEITLIHTSPSRLGNQRNARDHDIQEGKSETAFGRSSGTTNKLNTDASILISRLKTDYEEKSKIVMYNSNDPTNRDRKKDIHVSSLNEKKKYVKEGIVTTSGSRAPFHKGHEHQMQKVMSLADEKNLTAHAIVGGEYGSSKAYDVEFTPSDVIKIMNLSLKGKVVLSTSGTTRFIKGPGRKVVKIVPEESIVVLGKDRLPAGFTEGTYEDLLRDYPEFFEKVGNKDPITEFHKKGYNYFVNAGSITMEGTAKTIDSTFIRKQLIAGDTESVRACLCVEIFDVLTKKENMKAIKNRYHLIQKRNNEIAALAQKYKHTDPISKKDLGVNEEGKKINLTKTYAKKNYKDPNVQAKIFRFIERGAEIIKSKEKEIEKKYSKLIHYDNKLDLTFSSKQPSLL